MIIVPVLKPCIVIKLICLYVDTLKYMKMFIRVCVSACIYIHTYICTYIYSIQIFITFLKPLASKALILMMYFKIEVFSEDTCVALLPSTVVWSSGSVCVNSRFSYQMVRVLVDL